jgi:peptidase E
MTKYILHGGDTREFNEDNESFFREMTSGLEGNITILLVYFAKDGSKVEQLAIEDKVRFTKNSENKNLEFLVANLDEVATQLNQANVVYIRGGDTALLLSKLNKIPNFANLIEGKIIGGSSAGAYALGKYFWENDTGELGEGLGILNIKVYCHYKPEDGDIVKQLLNNKEKLPLLVLPSYKWQIFYQ